LERRAGKGEQEMTATSKPVIIIER
jgi:hypothetical protein